MTYKSKRTITSIAAGILFLAAYLVYALGKNSPAPENLKSWALTMLIFIGISVAVSVVIQILFHIAFSIGIAVKEGNAREVERIVESSMVEDEMDKLINLKSVHIGYICAGIGFVAALAALAFGASAVFALHILFGSFAGGSFVEGGVSVYLYERGVRNG